MSQNELQSHVVLLEEKIGSLEKLVVDISAHVDLLHSSAVMAGEIMEGILDNIDDLGKNNAKV
jgi:hypothetical protein